MNIKKQVIKRLYDLLRTEFGFKYDFLFKKTNYNLFIFSRDLFVNYTETPMQNVKLASGVTIVAPNKEIKLQIDIKFKGIFYSLEDLPEYLSHNLIQFLKACYDNY